MSNVTLTTNRTGLVDFDDHGSYDGLVLIIVVTSVLVFIVFVVCGMVVFYFLSDRTESSVSTR